MALPYQPLTPTGTVPLLSDYKNVQGNFAALDTSFGVDHTLFSDSSLQNGYHTLIHFIPQVTPATNTIGYGRLYTKTADDGIASSQELFYNIWNGASSLDIQLTRNFLPVASINGYTFMPGGIIMQWAHTASLPSGTFTPITYASLGLINFPGSVFSIQAVPSGTLSSTIGGWAISALSNAGFSIQNSTGINLRFYVTVIGN